MRRLFLWLLAFCLAGGGGYEWGRWKRTHAVRSSLSETFRPAPYPVEQKPFILFLTGRNNGAFVESMLTSALSQVYEPYRVLYIDDASDDGSDQLARDVIAESDKGYLATFVRNEESIGFAANLLRAVATARSDELFVILGSGESLAHEWVLSRLNAYFAHPDLWLAYGQALEMPGFRPGLAASYGSESVRETPLRAPYLVATYATLLRQIQEGDLLYQGRFLPTGGELAAVLPLLEMSEGHTQFIDEILSLHVREGKGGEDRDLQLRCERHIRGLKPYSRLERLPEGETHASTL